MLNSLSGDLTSSSLALLAEAGRFEELGKRGVWSGARVASSAAGVRLDVLALDVATAHSPSWMGGVLRLLASRAAARVVSGLPLHGFDLDRSLEAAFRLLQSGGSTGKVVVRVVSPPRGPRAGGGAAQLLTGGTGSLGVLTCLLYTSDAADE